MIRPGARRFPRDKLIPKIGRIIENIEQNPTFTKEIKPGPTILSQAFAGTLRFRVKALWVVGSFAHGAKECGDLDLVVDAELLKGSPNTAAGIAACIRNGEKKIDVLVGTPESNHAGMEFPGAVLIWTRKDRDWNSKVSSIAVPDGEVRIARVTDRLPVDHKVLRLRRDDAEALVEKLSTGHYDWTIVPYDTIAPAVDKWPEAVRDSLQLREAGKEASRARDHALEYILQKHPISPGKLTGEARHWRFGNFEIFCAPTERFSITALDSNYACTSIVVAPPSRAGSALWVIRRSPEHPLTKSLLIEKCWLEFSGGEPIHFHHSAARYWRALRLEPSEPTTEMDDTAEPTADTDGADEPPADTDDADEADAEAQSSSRQVCVADALAMSPGIVSFELEHGILTFPLNERSRQRLGRCLIGATIDNADFSARIHAIEGALKVPAPETLLAALHGQLKADPLQGGDFLAGGYYSTHLAFDHDD